MALASCAASSSLSGQPPTVNGVSFGSTTALTFDPVTAKATASLMLYKVESVVIKATAGSVTTPDGDDLRLSVMHTAADHAKFDSALPSPQAAGTPFNFNANLAVVDTYGNVCDTTNGGTAYSGTKDIAWTLSGTAGSPDGLHADTYVSPVTFSGGISTTALSATLYRAQTTTITADISPALPILPATPERSV